MVVVFGRRGGIGFQIMKPKFFDLAIKLAEKSTHPQHKMGCVLVKKNKVISVGWNQLKTHPRSGSYGHYLHAEIHCLLGVSSEDSAGGTIYVARVGHDRSPRLSRPCPSCLLALVQSGIRCVCYFDERGNAVTESITL